MKNNNVTLAIIVSLTALQACGAAGPMVKLVGWATNPDKLETIEGAIGPVTTFEDIKDLVYQRMQVPMGSLSFTIGKEGPYDYSDMSADIAADWPLFKQDPQILGFKLKHIDEFERATRDPNAVAEYVARYFKVATSPLDPILKDAKFSNLESIIERRITMALAALSYSPDGVHYLISNAAVRNWLREELPSQLRGLNTADSNFLADALEKVIKLPTIAPLIDDDSNYRVAHAMKEVRAKLMSAYGAELNRRAIEGH